MRRFFQTVSFHPAFALVVLFLTFGPTDGCPVG
jgi:hypothetical protein